jgi:hypothetical protein
MYNIFVNQIYEKAPEKQGKSKDKMGLIKLNSIIIFDKIIRR